MAFVVSAIGGAILSMIKVDAQSAVNDSASCESSTFDEAVNLIREDLKDVKNVLESNQQQNNALCISKSDFEELKAACVSNQQQCSQTELSTSKHALASSFLCEYTTRITHF